LGFIVNICIDLVNKEVALLCLDVFYTKIIN